MNLTLAVDAKVVEKARAIARQQGKSLNAMVRQYLERLTGTGSDASLVDDFERLWKKPGGRSKKPWRFDRQEIYAERLQRHRSP